MAHSGRRQCPSSSNDVSLPFKSYADLPQAAGADIGGQLPVGGHQRREVRGTAFRNIDPRADGLARCQM